MGITHGESQQPTGECLFSKETPTAAARQEPGDPAPEDKRGQPHGRPRPGAANGAGRPRDLGAGLSPPPHLQLFPTSGDQAGQWRRRPDGRDVRVTGGDRARARRRSGPHSQLGKMYLPLEPKNSESKRSKAGGLGRVPGALRSHYGFSDLATEHSRTEAH